MSATLVAREPGPQYEIGIDAARKVHLYRLYQTRGYEGALFDRPDRATVIENAFAFARWSLKFRGTPALIPVRTVSRAAHGYERLPDILCIGELPWARPVREVSQMFSAATLVWFQDAFALPIAREVLEEMRELDWTRIAEDWSW